MNNDTSRKCAHDLYYLDFIQRNNLSHTWFLPVADKGFTYHDIYLNSFICIDHFNISSGCVNGVLSVERYDIPVNPSKHLPIIMDIEMSRDHSGTEQANKGTNNVGLPIAWHKVIEDKKTKYQARLDEYLDSHVSIPDVANCDDATCNSHVHKQQIDQWCSQLIDCCLNSDVCLPRVNPRWREDVQPYKTECIWWHNLWVQQDHPKQGGVYDRMREAKRQYLYANRRNKRKEDQLRKERMAEDICNNRSREFERCEEKLS